MVAATCACGRVTADDECPPICNYNPKETEMNTTTRKHLTVGWVTFDYDPAELADLVLVEVQPHQGALDAYVDYPELVEQRCREWLGDYPGDFDDELQAVESALDAGDMIPVLAYDKQFARVTPLSELSDEQLARVVGQLERLGVFVDITPEDIA